MSEAVTPLIQFFSLQDAVKSGDVERIDAIFGGTALLYDRQAAGPERALDPWTSVPGSYWHAPQANKKGFCIVDVAPVVCLVDASERHKEMVRHCLHAHVLRTGEMPHVGRIAASQQAVSAFDWIFASGHVEKGLQLVATPGDSTWSLQPYRQSLLQAMYDRFAQGAVDSVDLTPRSLRSVQDAYDYGAFSHAGAASHGLSGEGGILMRQIVFQRDVKLPLFHALCGTAISSKSVLDDSMFITQIVTNILTSAQCAGQNLHGKSGLLNASSGSRSHRPLHCASAARNLPLCRELLAFGANPLAKDFGGRTPREALPIDAPDTLRQLLAAAEAHATAQAVVQSMRRGTDRSRELSP